jgi:pimeloyl-ACP methyl ester carboxylesterase
MKALVLTLLLGACAGEQPPSESSENGSQVVPCETPSDGVCDELVTCALGSDQEDCEAACADGDDWRDLSDAMVGVCAHAAQRALVADAAEEEIDPSVGTWGSGGVVGTWDGQVTVRGAYTNTDVDRHYRVYAPRRINPDVPTPLVFVLGGFMVDMYWLAEYTEMNRTADLNDFIVVYGQPEWRDFGSYWVYAWYVYDQAFQGDWEDNPDVAYLRAVYDEVGALYNLDRSRIYTTGHSRGAAMSIIAAFEAPEMFAGACAQAGFVTHADYDESDVGVEHSDTIEEVLQDLDWEEGEDYVYDRLEGVSHEWQSQYNQQVWEFLSTKALPLEGR